MMGAIHQMERELRAERAAAGRASAKARGKTGGRARTDAAKLENARILYENSGKPLPRPARLPALEEGPSSPTWRNSRSRNLLPFRGVERK
jgi:DNA invertase Pin-like site-specific DNA recombinase